MFAALLTSRILSTNRIPADACTANTVSVGILTKGEIRMAERRMFAKTIIDSDAFLDMPLSSQALYFHLSMRADDDGFINNPKKIQRMIGASDDDLKLLIAKRFIIPFDSGIVVIKHWKIHNYIQRDRYKETVYKDEKARLTLKDNNAYTLSDTPCIQDGYSMETQVRLGKDSIELELGKDSIELLDVPQAETSQAETPQVAAKKTKRFIPPSLEDVQSYCLERGNSVDAERFIDYYTANGWMVGKNKMKDWKAAIRTWERSGFSQQTQPRQQRTSGGNVFLEMAKEEGIF